MRTSLELCLCQPMSTEVLVQRNCCQIQLSENECQLGLSPQRDLPGTSSDKSCGRHVCPPTHEKKCINPTCCNRVYVQVATKLSNAILWIPSLLWYSNAISFAVVLMLYFVRTQTIIKLTSPCFIFIVDSSSCGKGCEAVYNFPAGWPCHYPKKTKRCKKDPPGFLFSYSSLAGVIFVKVASQ